MSTRHTRRPALSEEERAARMDAAHQALVDAVETIASSDDWMAMLQTARRLPSYSPRNCLLLASQGAEGMVMGYQAWKQIPATDGGTCQVARGAKGLKVLAPVTRSVTDADPVTGQEVKGSKVVGFRLISVFDETALVSPPDLPGQELLTPIVLEGDAPARLWEALAAQVDEAGYQLDTSAELAAQIAPSNGRTDFLARIVCVRPDLPPLQMLKTLTHELAHIHLHAPGKRPATLTRAIGEVEAESVAYLVNADLGLDSSAYTIPYVAGWSHGDADTVLATAHRAITTARTISDQARLYLTSPDLETPRNQVSGPPTAEPSQTTGSGSTPVEQPPPQPGTGMVAEPDPEPDPDGWPDYLDDITPLSPGTEPAGQGPGETPGELSPRQLEVVRGETSAPGPQVGGELDGVVLGTASGAWRLRWEPARAALTGVHLTGPDDPEQYVSRTVQVHAHPGEDAPIGALEEQLGFALPTSVRDHLSAAQTIRPATLTTGGGGFGAIGGQRNFPALYPAAPAPDGRSAAPAMEGAIDERVAVGERPTPSSPVLIPGHPARAYAAALAEQPPLRSWTSAGFGVQILSAAPDPGYAGHLAITYRITHDDVVIVSADDLLAPLGTDPASDLAVRHAAEMATDPSPGLALTPAQEHFAQVHGAALTALTRDPHSPYPPETRVRIALPTSAQSAAVDFRDPVEVETASVTGIVVQPIGEDGGPVTSYAWRPDTAALPGHPWADNPGHALITPAEQVQPTLAAPDTGLSGWTPDIPLTYGAEVSFLADDAHPVEAVVLRAHATSTGLAYDVQPNAAGISPLRVPAHDLTAIRGTAWPSVQALLAARETAGLALQPGEVLHVGGQTSHVLAGPDGPQITRQHPSETTHHLQHNNAEHNDLDDAERLGPGQQGLDAEAAPCRSPDCADQAEVTVSIGWPSGQREITNRCRPCAAQLTIARLPRGCGIDISPLPDNTPDLALPVTPATAPHPAL